MCGRFVNDRNRAELADAFDAMVHDDAYWDWDGRYNIPPTTVIPTIALNSEGERSLVPMRWGLHPHWRKETPQGKPLFNARVETAHEKPSFRTPWRRRRALIPMTGWYEWTKEQGGRQPWYIKSEDKSAQAFAGLWDQWRVDEGITLLSCTILTTDALGPVSRLHHRMPVRLPEGLWTDWLNPELKASDLIEGQRDGEDLIFWEVDRAVNSNRSQGPALIHPSV